VGKTGASAALKRIGMGVDGFVDSLGKSPRNKKQKEYQKNKD